MNAYDVAVGGPRFSTAGVSAKDSFGLWESILNESMMGCSLEPLTTGRFHGTLDPFVHSEPISIVQMASSDMLARRTHRHIASSVSQDVILSLTTAGLSEMRCGAYSLGLPAGTMSIVDCEQPQESVMSGFQCIVIRIQRDLVMSAAGLGEDDFPPVTRLQPVGHEALVIDYFRRLVQLSPQALGNTAMLNAGIELVAAALALAVDQRPDERAAGALLRQQVITFLKANISDPELTADRIASACGLSRRKLFRIFTADGGPMMLLRRMRTDRARELLLAAPDRTIVSIAHACGFGGDRNFYRVFRSETGLTPSEYREHALSARPRVPQLR